MKSISLARLVKGFVALLVLLIVGAVALKGPALWRLHTLFDADRIVHNFRNMGEIFDSRPIKRSGPVLALASAPKSLPERFSFQGKERSIKEWINNTGTTGLLVIADGKIAYEQYLQGSTAESKAISWSVNKSFVSALIGAAIAEGKIASVEDPVIRYVPELATSGYAGATIQQVLEMSSGVLFTEDYADFGSSINQLGRTIALGQSMGQWIARQPSERAPGQVHHYISIDTQVLAMVLKAATGKTPTQYLEEKLWSRLGVEGDGLWLTDATGMEIAFGGLNLRTRDYARFGLLYLHGGRNLAGEQALPAAWVQESTRPRAAHLQPGQGTFEGQPKLGYAYQWWIPTSDEGEFMAIGVYGQFVYVNPKRQVVIAKNSAYANYHVDGDRMEYESLEAFRAIARSISP